MQNGFKFSRSRTVGMHFCYIRASEVNIVPITNKAVGSSPVHGEVYLIQHYVVTFASDLREVGGFLRVLRFPPPIKLTAMIKLKKF